MIMQNKIQFHICYVGPIHTNIHKLLTFTILQNIYNHLVPAMRSKSPKPPHLPTETLQVYIYNCTRLFKIMARHSDASWSVIQPLHAEKKGKENRVEVPEKLTVLPVRTFPLNCTKICLKIVYFFFKKMRYVGYVSKCFLPYLDFRAVWVAQNGCNWREAEPVKKKHFVTKSQKRPEQSFDPPRSECA